MRRGWHSNRGKYRDFKARDLEGSFRRALATEALDRVVDRKFELSESGQRRAERQPL